MNTGIQINQIILQNHFRMPHRPTMQNWVDFLTEKGGGGGLARRPPAALPVIIHSSISFLFSDR